MTKLEDLEHVLQVFCKRLLPAYICSTNPKKFIQWQGNICKQAALMSIFIIEHMVGDEYTVEAYEGFFEHEKMGAYNHCWNYLRHHTDTSKNIICDITSTISYMDYCEHNDPMLHLQNRSNAVVQDKIKLIGWEQINIEKEMSQAEYYTQLIGPELEQELKQLLKFARLWQE